MKKLYVILLMVILAIAVVGCNNKSEEINQQYEQAMADGKSKVIEEEYDKAIDYFKLALEFKKEDTQAMNLIEQIKILMEVISLEEAPDIDYFYQIEQIEKINNIVTQTDVVKNKANDYKEIVIKNLDSSIDTIEDSINNGEYDTAKENLNFIIEECKKYNYLEEQVEKCNKLLDVCKEKKKEKQTKKEQQKQESSNSNGSRKESSSNNSDTFTKNDAKELIKKEFGIVLEDETNSNNDSYYCLSDANYDKCGKYYHVTFWTYVEEEDWWMHQTGNVYKDEIQMGF